MPMSTWARTAAACITAALLALTGACRHVGKGPPAEGDGGADTPADSGTGTDLPPWAEPTCSATLGTPCADLAANELEVVLDAEVLAGEGTWRFVDIGGHHGALAERDLGDGPEPVVVLPDPWIDDEIAFTYIAVLPDEVGQQLEPVAITDSPTFWNEDDDQFSYAVLARITDGYRIYGVRRPELGGDTDSEPDEDPTGLWTVTMVEQSAASFVGGIDVRGITRGQTAESGEVLCVYGDDVHCRNQWSLEVWAIADDSPFNGLAIAAAGQVRGLAVGDEGQMVRCLTWTWQAIPTSTTDDLLVVLATSAGYYAAGENGVYSTLVNASPQANEASTTHLAGADIVDLFWPLPFDPEAAGGIEISGLTADDCAFDLKGPEIISCFAAHALDGPVLGSTYWYVPMVGEGRFFLTENRLHRFTSQAEQTD
jgi:hypothetical protein